MKSRERITALLLTHHFDYPLHKDPGEDLNFVGFKSATVIRRAKAAGSTPPSNPRALDLVTQLGIPHGKITAIFDPKQAGMDPTDYLDKKAA